MKSSLKLLSTSISSVIALGLLTGLSTEAQAVNYIWDGGSGTWDNGVTGMWNGGATWTNGITSVAQFTSSTGTVTIGSNLTIGALQFSGATTSYTFDNSGGNTLDFSGAGISSTTVSVQLISSTGAINFNNSSSAGDSTITVSNLGSLNFLGSSTAGGASLSINVGDVTFSGSSTAATSIIDNQGNLYFNGTSSGGTATVSNGGNLVLSGNTSGLVTMGSLTNSSGGSAGGVVLGDNRLSLSGGLTLASLPNNGLYFELNTPLTSGNIKLTGGSFNGPTGTGQVLINLDDNVNTGSVVPGTYTLIDWTGFSAPNVDINDFVLAGALPTGLSPSTHLEIQGTTLVLVAVPEPATFVMPLVAALGMLWLRRRSARVAG